MHTRTNPRIDTHAQTHDHDHAHARTHTSQISQRDQVFTQNTPHTQGDIGNRSIGLGCYNFDSHNAQRIACKNKADCYGVGPSGIDDNTPYAWDEGDVEIGPGTYQIPYWVTLPKKAELTNLLVVAAPSASHIGMSTLRMEPQFMIVGHSAGVAASMAAAGEVDVHDVDMDSLHAKLVADKQILSTGKAPPGPAPAGTDYDAYWFETHEVVAGNLDCLMKLYTYICFYVDMHI